MKQIQHLTAMLLLAALTAGLSACTDAPDPITADTSAAATDTQTLSTAAETEEPRLQPELSEADFEGYDFRVITRGNFIEHWSSKDIYAAAENGDPINDAVYQRNDAVTEKYNFKITEIADQENIAAAVKKTVQAGEDTYDMICAGLNTPIHTLAPDGMLLDLYAVPNLDLKKPWYDQNANAALSIAGKLYATIGELTIMDNDATWVVLFNKKLAQDFDIDNLYDKVRDGSWTIDTMTALAKEVAADVNGDGVMDEQDRWGVIGESFNTYAYIAGAGCGYVAKDSDDIPHFTLEDERLYNAFEKAMALNGNWDICAYVTLFQPKYTGDTFVECLDPMFASDKVLFNTAGMNRVTLFRSMETDFGILPLPKYDEQQENYYSAVECWCTNSIAIPTTAADPARTGHIIEALSAESMYTLTPAYYDITLKTKASRDEESADMLDLIFASRVYDLACMYDFGSMFVTINTLCEQTNASFTSAVEKRMTAAQKALDKIVDFYLEQE